MAIKSNNWGTSCLRVQHGMRSRRNLSSSSMLQAPVSGDRQMSFPMMPELYHLTGASTHPIAQPTFSRVRFWHWRVIQVQYYYFYVDENRSVESKSCASNCGYKLHKLYTLDYTVYAWRKKDVLTRLLDAMSRMVFWRLVW